MNDQQPMPSTIVSWISVLEYIFPKLLRLAEFYDNLDGVGSSFPFWRERLRSSFRGSNLHPPLELGSSILLSTFHGWNNYVFFLNQKQIVIGKWKEKIMFRGAMKKGKKRQNKKKKKFKEQYKWMITLSRTHASTHF